MMTDSPRPTLDSREEEIETEGSKMVDLTLEMVEREVHLWACIEEEEWMEEEEGWTVEEWMEEEEEGWMEETKVMVCKVLSVVQVVKVQRAEVSCRPTCGAWVAGWAGAWGA